MQDHCYARPQYNHREVWYKIHRVSLEAPLSSYIKTLAPLLQEKQNKSFFAVDGKLAAYSFLQCYHLLPPCIFCKFTIIISSSLHSLVWWVWCVNNQAKFASFGSTTGNADTAIPEFDSSQTTLKFRREEKCAMNWFEKLTSYKKQTLALKHNPEVETDLQNWNPSPSGWLPTKFKYIIIHADKTCIFGGRSILQVGVQGTRS